MKKDDIKIEKFYNLLNEFNEILIYRHEGPDGDCLGAQFGLKEFIELNFPNKKVFAIGNDKLSKNFNELFPKFDDFNSEYKNTLAIVLDTPNTSRINNPNWSKSKKIIKIDHHIFVDKFEDLFIGSNDYSSTCEIIGELIINFNNYRINKNIAKYLTIGMITDTDRFRFDATTSNTLKIVSTFYDLIDLNELFSKLYSKTINDYKIGNKLFKKVKYIDNYAILVIPKSFFKRNNLKGNSVKMYVNDFLNPFETEFLLFASYDSIKKIWKISIRSKNRSVNELASKYNGGGHEKASGASCQNKKELNQLISDFKKLAIQSN